jgi:parallel beta-helix repeat protein
MTSSGSPAGRRHRGGHPGRARRPDHHTVSGDDGPYRVAHNTLTGNFHGILVEAFGSAPIRRVVVRSNEVSDNLLHGITVDGAEGARITRNTVTDNHDSGIHLIGTNDSLVAGNVIFGHTADVDDDGTTNCWRRNTFTTDGCN